MVFEWSDLISIAILVVLEGLLSGDNALVLAVLVLPLPEDQQRRALQYGLIGAFVLRVLAIFLVVELVKYPWVSLLGGLYLLVLVFKHFSARSHQKDGAPTSKTAAGWFGLSLFWTIVIKADLIDLVFAVDSILAAVGVTRGDPDKIWVLVAGGVLGILMMRLLTLQVLELIKRYPRLIDAAYVVIAWVGIELVVKYLHEAHLITWHIDEKLGITVVLALFILGFLYARMERPGDAAIAADADLAEQIILEHKTIGPEQIEEARQRAEEEHQSREEPQPRVEA